MTIAPEDKDWTWTISGACPDCGYNGPEFRPQNTSIAVRALARDLPVALSAHASPSSRPNDTTWAPVEYACHVRDVFRLYEYRLGLMLDQDAPTFPNWDQDETAIADRYLEQDPVVVRAELAEAGESLAAAFDRVSAEDWQRTGHRSDNKHFTVETFAVYMVHDPAHHYWDITGHQPSLL
jgi:DinB superfamily